MIPETPSAPQPEPGQGLLTVAPLTEPDAIAEFALARLWRPELEVDQWQAFLRDWREAPQNRGILSARNQRGAVLGFVPWWRQPDLEFGETLWAGPFIVREMGVRPLVRESLRHGLSDLSHRLGINLRVTEPD